MLAKLLLKGLATRIPGAYTFFSKGTGGTVSARYCYSVWLRHLVLASKSGMVGVPATVAELGPGDSLGIGLAALLSGADRYYGLDVVRHSTDERNEKIFKELIELFRQKAPIPGEQEFPNIFPLLDNYNFPQEILTADILAKSLDPKRLNAIEAELKNPLPAGQGMLTYFVPWDDPAVIRPGTVDFIFSQFVLEHVNDLPLTYRALREWLSPTGLMSHMIDFRCHGTAKEWNGHWAYGSFLWSQIKGGRPFLLNREPVGSHLSLLEKNNFRLVKSLLYDKNSGSISRQQLAEGFRHFSERDLHTWGVFMQAEKQQ